MYANSLHILRLYSFLECHMPHMQKLWIQTMSQKVFLSSAFLGCYHLFYSFLQESELPTLQSGLVWKDTPLYKNMVLQNMCPALFSIMRTLESSLNRFPRSGKTSELQVMTNQLQANYKPRYGCRALPQGIQLKIFRHERDEHHLSLACLLQDVYMCVCICLCV